MDKEKTLLESWNHVPLHLAEASFENLRVDASEALRSKAIPAFLHLLGRPLSARGLSLFGFGHMGKTHTVAAMLNAARSVGVDVGWIYGGRLANHADTSEGIAYCSGVPLLAIKSLDRKGLARHRKFNEARLQILQNRKKAGLPTITISSRSPADILERLRDGRIDDDESGTRRVIFEIVAEVNEYIEIPLENPQPTPKK